MILAGVSIAMLSGDNSILGRASSARETSGTRQIEERVKLAYTAAQGCAEGHPKHGVGMGESQRAQFCAG